MTNEGNSWNISILRLIYVKIYKDLGCNIYQIVTENKIRKVKMHIQYLTKMKSTCFVRNFTV